MEKYFLISDLHLDHKNIIKYCHRPFESEKDMNATILENWNSTVSDNDFVIFLGDLCMNKFRAKWWIKQLQGTIFFIKGNHDFNTIPNMQKEIVVTFNNENLLLIHSVQWIQHNWNGWVIHGHTHNNDLLRYPFINIENKTMNVSAELLNYTPIEISNLLKLRDEKINHFDSNIEFNTQS